MNTMFSSKNRHKALQNIKLHHNTVRNSIVNGRSDVDCKYMSYEINEKCKIIRDILHCKNI